jgi:transcription initiation factor TFIIB
MHPTPRPTFGLDDGETDGVVLTNTLDVECPDRTRERARTSRSRPERGVTTGINPAGFVADCLYKTGEEQRKWVTQRTVVETGTVTPTTDPQRDV